MKENKTAELETIRELVEGFENDKLNLTAFKEKKDGSYQSVSYGELQNLVGALASALRKIGIKKGDRVALLSENRLEWAVSYLATAYTGAVITPLDIFLSSREILSILETVQAEFLFCSKKYLSKTAPLENRADAPLKIICFDPGEEVCRTADPDAPNKEEPVKSFEAEIKKIETAELNKKQPFKDRRHIYFDSLIRLGENLADKKEIRMPKLKAGDAAALIFMEGKRLVELSHKNIVSNGYSFIKRVKRPAFKETVMAQLPLHHTYPAVFALISPLLAYSEVVLVSSVKNETVFQAARECGVNGIVMVPLTLEKIYLGIYQYLKKTGLWPDSILNSTTTINRLFEDAAKDKKGKELIKKAKEDLGLIAQKYFICGGAPLSSHLVAGLRALDIEVLGGYGLSEAAPVVSCNISEDNRPGSIGPALVDLEVKIDRPDKDGEGEILVKGPNVMRGYYKMPEETKRAIDSGGWLRTGDWGRMDEDGYIYITGRLKKIIVNKGGKNIYPREIEEKLLKSPYFEAAAVRSATDESGGEYPRAFIKLDSRALSPLEKEKGRKLSSEELDELVKKELAETVAGLAVYKIPRDFKIVEFEKELEEIKNRLFRIPDFPPLTPDSAIVKALETRKEKKSSSLIRTEKEDGSLSREDASFYQPLATAFLKKEAAAVLAVDSSDIDPDESFMEFMDSVQLTELAARLENKFKTDFPPSLFFEHTTLGKLSAHLIARSTGKLKEHFGAPPKEKKETRKPVRAEKKKETREPASTKKKPTPSETDPTAVVGMAGIFPGSDNLEEFWEHLEKGDDLISEIPKERFNWEDYREEADFKWGGFINDIDKFDADFFKISLREAELMDPQHRIFLQTVWAAIEDAGYPPSSLSGSRTGVFAGVSSHDYTELQDRDHLPVEAHTSTGWCHSVLTNRVSYLLNLHGPSESVDTACSAALTALNRAVGSIQSGECDMAIAGGVQILLNPKLFISFTKAGMLSPDGRCRTFDKDANGYVRGEGAGAVLLKPLSKAEADGDRIYGVIKGTAVNHGGKASSLTAPNPALQSKLLTDAYRNAGISPDTVGYIEAHGTATPLGDPVETEGLKRAFAELYRERGLKPPDAPHCGLGSVKTNIGHLETAAGIAGIIKTLLAMKHKKLPAVVHFKEHNPHIKLEGSPFYILNKTEEWKTLRDKEGGVVPRRAGISSFGFGGANSHVVLEEYRADANISRTEFSSPYLAVLSAKNADCLKAYAEKLAVFLEKSGGNFAMADLAYTLQIGREAMEERLALAVNDREELLAGLKEYLKNGGETDNLYLGVVQKNSSKNDLLIEGKEGAEFLNAIIEKKKLNKLARLWTSGVEIDWNLLYGEGEPRIISAPTYPFAKKRCWIADIKRTFNREKAEEKAESDAYKKISLKMTAPRKSAAEAAREVKSVSLKAAPESGGKEISEKETASTEDKTDLPTDNEALTADIAMIIKRELAAVSFTEFSKIDENKPFTDLGVDSILGVELSKNLEEKLKIELPATELYDYPSVGALAAYISTLVKPERLKPFAAERTEAPLIREKKKNDFMKTQSPSLKKKTPDKGPKKILIEKTEEKPGLSRNISAGLNIDKRNERGRDVAVIGMSARFPGAGDLDEFWKNLADGGDSVSEVPPERWDWRKYYDPDPTAPGKTYCKRGGFLKDVDKFDPLFFNISPAEARLMDPQQRLFLEESWKAFEDAGYSPSSLENLKCGVYVGVMNNDYERILIPKKLAFNPSSEMLGNANSVLAARIGYFLNLTGAAVAINTACSSSLVAVHMACQSLIKGETDMMLAGGVTLYLSEEPYIMMSKAGMLSPEGKCKTFDDSADGFVPGEGVGALVLKSLAGALEDGDRIYGVIKGSAINQDGRTNGITAPSAESQKKLELEAYRDSGINPETITYVETHGTGTKLGDPVEVKGLKASFGEYTEKKGFCALGSVKSNIGHTSAAAGVAGMVKVLLSMKHGKIPPSPHFKNCNRHINFENSPFYVNRELKDWNRKDGLPRRAAVSAFGFSGTNAHLTLEEHIPAAEAEIFPPYLLVLSAGNQERLKERAAKLSTFLEKRSDSENSKNFPADLTYTLQTGREAMEERLAIVAESGKELLSKLKEYLENQEGISGLYLGNVKKDQAKTELLVGGVAGKLFIKSVIDEKDIGRLAQLWVSGVKIDWNLLYGENRPRKISTPSYPFQKRSYWMDLDVERVSTTEKKETEARPDISNKASDTVKLKPEPKLNLTQNKRLAFKEIKNSPEKIGLKSLPEKYSEVKAAPSEPSDKYRYAGPIKEHTAEATQKPAQNHSVLILDIKEIIKKELAAVSLIEASEIDEEKTFMELGVDSIFGVELIRKLRNAFDIDISAPKLYDYPTVNSLAVYLSGVLKAEREDLEKNAKPASANTINKTKTSYFKEARLKSGDQKILKQKTKLKEPAEEAPRDKTALISDIKEIIKKELAAVSLIEASEIDEEKTFMELGVDSIFGVELIRKLRSAFDIDISAPKLYDYPSVNSLAVYLSGVLEKEKKSGGVVKSTSVKKVGHLDFTKTQFPTRRKASDSGVKKFLKNSAASKSKIESFRGKAGLLDKFVPFKRGHADDIAVIGMSARFPDADNTDEFWRNLAAGRDSVREVPPERWDWREHYDPDPKAPGKTYCKRGAFLKDVDKFDPLFFNISPAEAELMDPQQRLFLEESWKALEDAGYSTSSLSGLKCGVFAGVMTNDYSRILSGGALGNNSSEMLGNSNSILAARIAYFLNLKGAALAIDTACSSALVAIHLARQSLLKGEADMALAGGVTVYLSEDTYIMMSSAGMLSMEGKCKTFDDGADGFVPGEGAGVVVLKTLAGAIKDGDRIYGVIKGSGVNQDGKSNGITAPSSESQKALELEVCRESGINPETITYVEAHGTGTKLGDPIEIEALSGSFGEFTDKKQYCAIGSVKTNIGHTSAAAGTAGMIKILLSMKHGKIPPSLHFKECNRHIKFEDTPFYVGAELKEWTKEGNLPRRAALSSFGFSGTNAHMILEEYQPEVSAPVDFPPPYLATLSAKNKERLKVYAEKLIKFLENSGKETDYDLKSFTDGELLKQLSELINIPEAELDKEASFEEQGIEYIKLEEWRELIEKTHNLKLDPAVFMERLSIDALSAYLVGSFSRELYSRAGNLNGEKRPDKQDISMTELVYSLQVGREAMEERLALLARDKKELLTGLKNFLKTGEESSGLYLGNVKKDKGKSELLISGESGKYFIEKIIDNKEFNKLARLWVGGTDIDWKLLYGENRPRKISLPAYPFVKKRCWIAEQTPKKPVNANRAVDGLHPLIDVNVSDFKEQAFEKEFSGNEFYLTDHQIKGEKILPGSVYLEMAKAAAELAHGGAPVRRLKNLIWSRPLKSETDPERVKIALCLEKGKVLWEIAGQNDGKVYSQGELEYLLKEESQISAAFDLEAVKKRCSQTKTGSELYKSFRKLGFEYGSAFQTIESLSYNKNEVLAQLKLPKFLKSGFDRFGLHPSLLDGAFQTAAGLLQNGEKEETFLLPFGFKELEITGPLTEEIYVYTVFSGRPGLKEKIFDIKLLDRKGNLSAAFKNFSLRAFKAFPQAKTKTLTAAKAASSGHETLYLESVWQSAPLEEGKEKFSGRVLIFAENEALFETLKKKYPESEPVLVKAGKNYRKRDRVYQLNPGREEDYQTLINDLTKENSPPNFILYLPSGTEETAGRFYGLFYLTKALIKAKTKEKIRLLSLYQNNSDMVDFDRATGALAKTAAIERPRFFFQTLGLDNLSDSGAVLNKALKETRLSAGAVEVRYQGDERQVRVLKEFKPEKSSMDKPLLKKEGVYLITGGLGGLGMIIARYLAKNYRAKLILVGRSELGEDKKEKLSRLEKAGGEALYLSADISKPEEVEKLIKKAGERFGTINGLIHSAGTTKDSLISKKSAAEIKSVFAPKIEGALNLDRALKDEKLDLMVFFSSAAGVSGNMGQADYAYANAFLDSLARSRRKLVEEGGRFGETISINWPYWAEGGMRLDQETLKWIENTQGASPLSTEEGLKIFEASFGLSKSQFLALRGKVEKLKKTLGLKTPDDRPAKRRPADSAAKEKEVASGAKEKLTADLTKMAAGILKVGTEEIDPEENISQYGFDSITFTEFANLLNQEFGLEVDPPEMFENPTINSLAEYLWTEYKRTLLDFYQSAAETEVEPAEIEYEPDPEPDPDPTDLPILKSRFAVFAPEISENAIPRSKEIAVIGMSARFPGAENLEEFWRNLLDGKDCVGEIPAERWDWRRYQSEEEGLGYSKWGAFLKDADKFDAEFFDISPREAELMDPQQRLFLEVAWETLEAAGYRASALSGSETGLFIGVSGSSYYSLLQKEGAGLEAHTPTGVASSILANRVSYLFDWHGPSESVDTACSSSLVAMHRAIQAINAGDCDLALAGGVNLMLTPDMHIAFSKAGMMSGDGRCKTFDEKADGYVRGEGVGAVLLKPLEEAARDGDTIYGVIKGGSVNHGGQVSSLTAPNPRAQAKLIVKAHRKTGASPESVGYIECHGTGTSLGDPIEISGLKRAFVELYQKEGLRFPDRPHCGLGSVKTNIGHLEAAAGIAGIIKTLLAFQYKTLPKTLHFQNLNPYIKLEKTPFYVVDQTQDWRHLKDKSGNDFPLRAGVSSFGFGGANAHIVLEEYRAAEAAPQVELPAPYLIPLSAKTKESLEAYAKRICQFAEAAPELSLSRLARTLQTGREAMEERLALTVNDKTELLSKLKEYLKNGKGSAGVRLGNVKTEKAKSELLISGESGKSFIEKIMENRELDKLAQLWTGGVEIDWNLLYGETRPRRISLPTYPFAKERHWIEEKTGSDFITKKEIPAISVKSAASSTFPDADEEIRAALLAEEKILSSAFSSTVSLDNIQDWISELAGKVLKLKSARTDINKSLEEYGMDSVMMISMIRKINKKWNIEVVPEELAEHTDIASISQYLFENYFQNTAKEPTGVPRENDPTEKKDARDPGSKVDRLSAAEFDKPPKNEFSTQSQKLLSNSSSLEAEIAQLSEAKLDQLLKEKTGLKEPPRT